MANREPSRNDAGRPRPPWSVDDDAARDRDRGTTTGSLIGDVVTHMTGHPDLHYPRGEDHIGIATSETARSTAGMAPSREDWRLAEPAVHFGHGAWNHHGGENVKWSDELEDTLQREWRAMRHSEAWQDVRDWVRRGWESARRRQ